MTLIVVVLFSFFNWPPGSSSAFADVVLFSFRIWPPGLPASGHVVLFCSLRQKKAKNDFFYCGFAICVFFLFIHSYKFEKKWIKYTCGYGTTSSIWFINATAMVMMHTRAIIVMINALGPNLGGIFTWTVLWVLESILVWNRYMNVD